MSERPNFCCAGAPHLGSGLQGALARPPPKALDTHERPTHLIGCPAAREEVAVIVAVQGDVEDARVAVEGLLGPVAMVHVLRAEDWLRTGCARTCPSPSPCRGGSGAQGPEGRERGQAQVASTRPDCRLQQWPEAGLSALPGGGCDFPTMRLIPRLLCL